MPVNLVSTWLPAARPANSLTLNAHLPSRAITNNNPTLVIPAFETNQTQWDGSSQAVAQFCAPVTGSFSILLPVRPPSGVEFCPVVRWTDSNGTVRRLKLFSGVGEVLPLDVYAGERIIAPAAIEIWNTQNHNPTTLAAPWAITLGLYEAPTSSADTTGVVYAPTACILTYPANFDQLMAECLTCT